MTAEGQSDGQAVRVPVEQEDGSTLTYEVQRESGQSQSRRNAPTTTCSMCFDLRHFRCRGNCACDICAGRYNTPQAKARRTRIAKRRGPSPGTVPFPGRSVLPPEVQAEILERLKTWDFETVACQMSLPYRSVKPFVGMSI